MRSASAVAPSHLANKEFSLLRALATDPTRVFTKEELLRDVWGFQSMGRTRTLDSHASRLRRKLDPEAGRYVVNCWGVGYRLIDAPEARLMLEAFATSSIVAWPLALTLATVVVSDRARRRRRRELLNRVPA